MHYSILVITPTKDNIDNEVAELLSNYGEESENYKWDWYVIGGRWCGLLIGYKPHLDPKWYRPCGTPDPILAARGFPTFKGSEMCRGTGSRPGSEGFNKHQTPDPNDCCPFPIKEGAIGCNGCHGTGMELSFGSNHRIEQDTIRLKDMRKDISTYGIITPDGKWYEEDEPDWETYATKSTEELGKDLKARNDLWREKFPKILAPYMDTHYATIVDIHS